MKMKLTDPIREFIDEGWLVNIHLQESVVMGVRLIAATEAYLAYEDPEDASQTSWKATPWYRIVEVAYVSPNWKDQTTSTSEDK